MELSAANVPVRAVHWTTCYRIIPSRFPPIQLFERVADPADLDAVFAIEALTNDRLREEAGDLRLVPVEDRISGPGSSFVMASFTHPAPTGGRFTDGTFGAYYAARERDTAISETVYHRERFMAATAQPPMELDVRVLRATLRAELHDLCGAGERHPAVYDLHDYTAGQALARALRLARSHGIVYDSVRHAGGTCAAVFRPRALSACKQAEHLVYAWDGERISTIYQKKFLRR